MFLDDFSFDDFEARNQGMTCTLIITLFVCHLSRAGNLIMYQGDGCECQAGEIRVSADCRIFIAVQYELNRAAKLFLREAQQNYST
jgi:hypothetical protein